MSTRRTRASRQPELFARSTRPVIVLELNHRASGRKRLREFRLFAKDKTKAVRNKLTAQLANLVEEAHTHLGHALHAAAPHTQRLRKYAKVAHAKAKQLHTTMRELLPQIRYWLETGFVAANKIVSLHIPKLYSIVRGKAGKKVELGLHWGSSRLGGGFLLARVAADRRELVDARYAVDAVNDHIALFGKPPKAYAYDRAGYSADNVETLKVKGVTHVSLAPRGRAPWPVRGTIKDTLTRERAQVEGGIGAIKHARYGFNKPAARSAPAMAMCGQRAVLGFNLNKWVRGLAKRTKMELVG